MGLSSACPPLTLLRIFAVDEFSSNLASSWVAMERTLFSRSSPSSPAGGALWQDSWCHTPGTQRGGSRESNIKCNSSLTKTGMFYILDLQLNLPQRGSCCLFAVSCSRNRLPVSCHPVTKFIHRESCELQIGWLTGGRVEPVNYIMWVTVYMSRHQESL